MSEIGEQVISKTYCFLVHKNYRILNKTYVLDIRKNRHFHAPACQKFSFQQKHDCYKKYTINPPLAVVPQGL